MHRTEWHQGDPIEPPAIPPRRSSRSQKSPRKRAPCGTRQQQAVRASAGSSLGGSKVPRIQCTTPFTCGQTREEVSCSLSPIFGVRGLDRAFRSDDSCRAAVVLANQAALQPQALDPNVTERDRAVVALQHQRSLGHFLFGQRRSSGTRKRHVVLDDDAV